MMNSIAVKKNKIWFFMRLLTLLAAFFASSNIVHAESINGKNITWIGDSYSVLGKTAIENAFPGLDIDECIKNDYVKSEKWFQSDANPGGKSGLKILDNIIASGKLQRYLVFALGTNGGQKLDTDTIESVVKKIMEVNKSNIVVFMTPYTAQGSDYSTFINNLQKVKEKYPNNVIIADWESIAKGHDDWFNDKIHPNGHYAEWVQTFVSAISSNFTSVAPTSYTSSDQLQTIKIGRRLDFRTMDIFSRNNILFYNPNGGCLSGGGFYNGVELTYADLNAVGTTIADAPKRLKLMVETYGEYAMQLQIEYGVPWEVVFAQTFSESHVGANPASSSRIYLEPLGYFNMMGMELFTARSKTDAVIVADGGVCANDPRKSACYSTPSRMLLGWATVYLHNGAYNFAYANLNPDSYNLDGFINNLACMWVKGHKGSCGDSSYAHVVKERIKTTIEDVRVKKGWPTSTELAKQHNIPIGGNYPLDTTNDHGNVDEIMEDLKSGKSSLTQQSTPSSSSSSGSTLHAPSGDGWLSESDIAGYSKSTHRFENGQTIGIGCSRLDDNIAKNGNPTKFAEDSASGARLPQMIILHYMAANMAVDGYDYCKDVGSNGDKISVIPHFSIYPKEKRVVQHVPLTQPSGSVEEGETCNSDTGVDCWDRYGIQIEINGTAEQVLQYGEAELSYIADLMVAIAKQTGIPLTSSVDWSGSDSSRLSGSAYKSYVGVLGHMHAPYKNTSPDPGPIWDKLKAEIDKKDYSVGCSGGDSSSGTNYCAEGESCTSDGFTVYSQGDTRWNGIGKSKWSTMGSNGCGPSAFATAATNLLRKKITPGEVADYMCSNGLTCGSAMPRGNASKLAEHFGLEFKDLTDEVKATDPLKAEQTINEYLKSGWIIQGVFTGCFTSSGGHFLLIRELTPDGKWKIATNPKTGVGSCSGYIGSSTLQNEVEWDPQAYIISHIKGNTTFALRSTNSGACVSTCQEQSSGTTTGQLVTGGFKTAEEADKAIMEAYRALKDTSPTKLHSDFGIPQVTCHEGEVGEYKGYTIFNCVGFSYYFLNKYTDLRLKGGGVITDLGVGGKGVVGKLVEHLNLPTGDEPKPYAIFSYNYGDNGHTGVVLGVPDENTMIIGEASCGGGRNHIGAFKYVRKNGVWYGVDNPNGMTNWGAQPTFKFAYTDGHLKGL